MPIDIKPILTAIEKEISKLAKTSFQNFLAQAETDGKNILNTLKDDIQTWTSEVTAGRLSEADLKFLIEAKKELIIVSALTQAGLAQIQLDQFKSGVIDIITKAIISVIP